MNNDFGLSLKAVFKREELKELTKEVMEKTENFLKKYIKQKNKGGIKVSLLKEFKAFDVRANVLDMAIGVIIGGAYSKIVYSLVKDVSTGYETSQVQSVLDGYLDEFIFAYLKSQIQ